MLNLYVGTASWQGFGEIQNLTEMLIAGSPEEAMGQLVKQGQEKWPRHNMNGMPLIEDVSNVAVDFVKSHRSSG